MGAYLSEPNVETISEDGASETLSYGASAVQGWRVAMEDSHNCITKLAEDTSLFAVYDGHGGAEVAIYTAQQLPRLLMELESFKSGDIPAALEEAFMKFDASLKEKAIVEKLRRIAGMEEPEEKEDNETETLLEEASLPLEELVARYCSHPSKTKRSKLKQSHRNDLLSPMIQKKQTRFPLTAVNGSLPDGDGPVPNKTVPFDDEGDVVPKGETSEGDGDSNIGGENVPDGDAKPDGENGIDSDDADGEEIATRAESSKNGGKEESHQQEAECVAKDQSGAGTSGASGSCNGDAESSGTKDAESSSGSGAAGSKVKEMIMPASDDDDEDDSDEDDEDYESEDEDDEDEEEEDDDEEGEDEEEDRGDYDEEEENIVSMQSGREEPGSDSGSTAVVALLSRRELTVANIGDSRCVLSRGGIAVEMSYDHKPEDEVELRRIEKAGGKVTLDGRVNGGLNLSRAFGDHCYKMTTSLPPKDQMISAFPDIQTATLTDEDDFMVIACDGIWNAMTSQEVIDFVRQKLDSQENPEKPNKLSKICEELFDFCLAPDTSGDGTGCDNMTCVIVRFHRDGAEAFETGSVGGKRKSTDDDRLEEADSKKPRH